MFPKTKPKTGHKLELDGYVIVESYLENDLNQLSI